MIIRLIVLSTVVVLLISSCAAKEQAAENATVATTISNSTSYMADPVTENIEEVSEKLIPDSEPVIERSSHFHHAQEPSYHGFWKKKFVWRPRWVKTWQAKKIYVATWKRMWAPASLNEWVPIPKPPPGWVKPGYKSYIAYPD